MVTDNKVFLRDIAASPLHIRLFYDKITKDIIIKNGDTEITIPIELTVDLGRSLVSEGLLYMNCKINTYQTLLHELTYTEFNINIIKK